MTASNHAAVKVASTVGGIAAVAVVIGAADLAAQAFGTLSGAAVIVVVFAACWLVHVARPLLHPVPPARHSGTREPEVTAETITLAGTAASR